MRPRLQLRARLPLRACAALALGLWSALPVRAEDPFLRRTTTVRVVEEFGPAVVNITTEQAVRAANPFRPFSGDPFFERFFQDFFEPRLQSKVSSLGSGVLIDAEGHVLTNEHVVARATRIRITLADGRAFDATPIGADPNNDIAVLKVETDEELPWVQPGSSGDLMVGEPVIAIGNPFGLSNSVTTGVISALDRSIRTESRVFHGFLQTDASINPGNSGDPLINAEGELVAINTAVYGGAQGIGFAIPIDVAKRIVAELIDHGEVVPVWLGLEFQDLSPALLQALGLPEDTRGALINRVRPGGPAARAGVRRGDVVTRIDGSAVQSARTLVERLESVTSGQELSLEVAREGGTRRLAVQAEELPGELIPQLIEEMTGLALEADAQGGYRVTGVREGSGAARIGLRAGDLLLGINGRPLDGEDALRRSVMELRRQSRAMIVVQRGSGRYHVAIPLA